MDPGLLLQLLRPRLSAMVAVSGLAGYFLHPAPAGYPALLFAGIFLLAGGCTALNQVQERDLDARMLRTARRPLPTGRLRPRTALLFASALLAGGLTLLSASAPLPLLFGLAAITVYNGVYTPMKRRSFAAVLPGALCGALPPFIGWTAAGGAPTDFRAVLLAGLMFLWQVPHFWLFAERHREDYERAAIPLPGQTFSPKQVHRLLFAWTAALAGSTSAFAVFATNHLPFTRAAILLLSPLLLAGTFHARVRLETAPEQLFRRLTGGMVMVLAVILLGGLLPS